MSDGTGVMALFPMFSRERWSMTGPASYGLLEAPQSTAADSAARNAVMVPRCVRPMRLWERSLKSSWTLSRWATDRRRIPSSRCPCGTSVDSPRMAEATGATITERRRRPNDMGWRNATNGARPGERFA